MKPIAWSHSALQDFNTCPKAFYHKRIAKDVKESQGEAAMWGDRVHKAFEVYLQGAEAGVMLDPELEIYHGMLDDVRRKPGELFAEQKLAINKRLQPCDWFDKDVWMRGIIDVLIKDGATAWVLDWKTGKQKDDPRQLKLFALLVFIHHPEVRNCITEFRWLRTGNTTGATYFRHQESNLWGEMLPDLLRYKMAFKHEIFVPRQSGLCNGWCPVQQCEYWKPKR